MERERERERVRAIQGSVFCLKFFASLSFIKEQRRRRFFVLRSSIAGQFNKAAHICNLLFTSRCKVCWNLICLHLALAMTYTRNKAAILNLLSSLPKLLDFPFYLGMIFTSALHCKSILKTMACKSSYFTNKNN